MGLSQCGLDVCFSDGYIGRMLLFMKSLPLCAVIETVPHSLVPLLIGLIVLPVFGFQVIYIVCMLNFCEINRKSFLLFCELPFGLLCVQVIVSGSSRLSVLATLALVTRVPFRKPLHSQGFRSFVQVFGLFQVKFL
jgi:hypothetical protein